jgi:hypothetical protein
LLPTRGHISTVSLSSGHDFGVALRTAELEVTFYSIITRLLPEIRLTFDMEIVAVGTIVLGHDVIVLLSPAVVSANLDDQL